MEHFNRWFVEHINLLKDDGYTPLHLAALNHLDVVTAFAEVVSGCIDMDLVVLLLLLSNLRIEGVQPKLVLASQK